MYAGSSRAAPRGFLELASSLGDGIARRGWLLVYGGARVGMMGACADAALRAGGRVEGVILDVFAGVAHRKLHALEVVRGMRNRKAALAERGDAFVALPGGFGTLEELSEILVERHLGQHRKPLVLVNPEGFWNPLLELFEGMSSSKLLGGELRDVLELASSASEALDIVAAGPALAEPRPLIPS